MNVTKSHSKIAAAPNQAGECCLQQKQLATLFFKWKYSQFGIRSLEKFDQFNQFGIWSRKERRVYTQ
jgi:hypothetical protein